MDRLEITYMNELESTKQQLEDTRRRSRSLENQNSQAVSDLAISREREGDLQLKLDDRTSEFTEMKYRALTSEQGHEAFKLEMRSMIALTSGGLGDDIVLRDLKMVLTYHRIMIKKTDALIDAIKDLME